MPNELLQGDSENGNAEHSLKLIGHAMDSSLLVNALELLVQVPAEAVNESEDLSAMLQARTQEADPLKGADFQGGDGMFDQRLS